MSGDIGAINAVTLVTADMGASLDFYRSLGFEVLDGGAEAAFTSLGVGAGFLNLQLVPGAAPVEVWGRIIFWVDDVDAVHRRASEAGIATAFPPTDAPWGERYFHVRDPHGHELSFARRLAPPT